MDATTEAAPFTAQTHGMLRSCAAFSTPAACSRFIERIPAGKGMPIKKPSGARIKTVSPSRRVRGRPRVQANRRGSRSGITRIRIARIANEGRSGMRSLHWLPNPEKSKSENRTAVNA